MSDQRNDPAPEPTTAGREPGRIHQRLHGHPALALTTKITVTLVGGVVALIGVVMLVTPGPAFVMIPLGLAILATEWDWAKRWLEKAKEQARKAKEKAEAMDPRVRRRRLLLTGLAVIVGVAAVTGYVVTYDWPSPAVGGWDLVQSLADWVPELPGM